MTNFSKVESYVAETIRELKDSEIDYSSFFPLPKTLALKITSNNKRDLFVSYAEKNEKAKLKGIWSHMIDRCHNEKSDGFSTHGSKGTYVCDEWKNNFDSFYNWSIENGYKFGLSLDRINNSDGYSPKNCRWVNHTAQARNRNSSKKISAFGEEKILIEWAEDKRCVVSYTCLRKRMKSKWEAEKAITTPSKEKVSTKEE